MHLGIPNEHVYVNVNVARPSGLPAFAAKRILDALNNEYTAPLKISIQGYTLPHPRNDRRPEEGVGLVVIVLVEESNVNVWPAWTSGGIRAKSYGFAFDAEKMNCIGDFGRHYQAYVHGLGRTKLLPAAK